MTSPASVGGNAAAYYASLVQSVGASSLSSGPSGATTAGSQTDSDGDGATSTSISPFAQLLSGLQQLQAQNPTDFTQVVSQIAGQLQSAAQQATGNQSTLLGNLANQFQNVADTGNLSPLQAHHHHGHHGGGAGVYGSNGQPTGNGSGSTSGNSGSLEQTLQQMFTDFSNEVDSALGNQSVASTSTGS